MSAVWLILFYDDGDGDDMMMIFCICGVMALQESSRSYIQYSLKNDV